MAFTRGQNRWRTPIEEVDKTRDLPKTVPPTPSPESQHPLPPAQLRTNLIEEYKAAHDGEPPDREWLMKEMFKRVGVNAIAEPRLKKTGGVPPKRS
jgi:hypothetical protein